MPTGLYRPVLNYIFVPFFCGRQYVPFAEQISEQATCMKAFHCKLMPLLLKTSSAVFIIITASALSFLNVQHEVLSHHVSSGDNIFSERNNFGVTAVVSSVFFHHLYQTSNPRLLSQYCGVCSSNVLTETNNFGVGAVLLSCVVPQTHLKRL